MQRPPRLLKTAAVSSLQRDFEMKSLGALELRNHVEQIPRLRIPVGAEHAHKALGRRVGEVAELLKADRTVDVVAQDRFAGIDVTRHQAFDSLLQESGPELRLTLQTLAHRFLEILSQGHFLL